ncbi:TPA: hypothetical protein MB171_002909, partial [Enterococcus faecium]|nr:hypothetical protein [Enterococcus faecium]HAQ1971937.1 hypothetical protein [Enterococcus faecium]HAQ1971939.1 hypothetical protein [Enterococcus faecium]HBT4522051.1 hypothetical protein [Enterococcus faecium]HBT4522053.1 hypothetical protein [Enterococcus faecium]
MKCNECNRV